MRPDGALAVPLLRPEGIPVLRILTPVRRLAAVAVIAGGVALAPAPALAAGGTAPSCIARTVSHDMLGYTHVRLGNNGCGRTMRVMVVWVWASDSRCYTIEEWNTAHEVRYAGNYDRTVVC
jgi:hypothetical protein